jgi:hypothetical protein
MVAGGWFVLREKYCWLVGDKPSEQAITHSKHQAVERPSGYYFFFNERARTVPISLIKKKLYKPWTGQNLPKLLYNYIRAVKIARSLAPAAAQTEISDFILATMDGKEDSWWLNTLSFLSNQTSQRTSSTKDRIALRGMSGSAVTLDHHYSTDSPHNVTHCSDDHGSEVDEGHECSLRDQSPSCYRSCDGGWRMNLPMALCVQTVNSTRGYLWQPAQENTVLSPKTDPLWSLSNSKVSSCRWLPG